MNPGSGPDLYSGHAQSLNREKRSASKFVALMLSVPLIIYISSLWLVRPLSLGDTFSFTLAAPGVLVLSILIVRIPRAHFLTSLSRVGIEFGLLFLIICLSVLSLVNSNDPIRSFRIIFPSVLPMTLFLHLVVVSYVSPGQLQKIPRMMIVGAFIFSVLPGLLALVLPPLSSYLAVTYRVRGFFENSIQHSIALGVIVPLVVVEFATARTGKAKAVWAICLLLMAFTTFRAGSKSVLGISFGSGMLLYALLAFRSRNFIRILFVLIGIVLLAVFLWLFGLQLAEMLNPVIAEKLRSIIEGGVSNYQSIDSRKLLWQEAINQGKRHWIVGSGAGEMVLGISHSHNLVLDYFKGIGVFGAAAILLLCLTILTRTAFKAVSVVAGNGDELDVRVLACYFASANYVVCSQLSDCFGPSTVGFLWIVYLSGRFLEGSPRSGLTPR
tara:strand:- start:1163 stop:2482 length:1320 start_codon:yes stop_codon:yes gene_type:complete